MTMDIQALRAAAGTITFIPEHYELVMEDNTPKGFDEKERTFIWEDPHSENSRIEVSLSLETGQLMRLQIDQERDDTIRGSAVEAGSTTEQAADIAKAFMIRHHPNYAALTWIRSEIKRNYVEIEFRAEVGGLPLPRSVVRSALTPISISCFTRRKNSREWSCRFGRTGSLVRRLRSKGSFRIWRCSPS